MSQLLRIAIHYYNSLWSEKKQVPVPDVVRYGSPIRPWDHLSLVYHVKPKLRGERYFTTQGNDLICYASFQYTLQMPVAQASHSRPFEKTHRGYIDRGGNLIVLT